MVEKELKGFIEKIREQFPGYEYEISMSTGEPVIIIKPVPEEESDTVMDFVESKILLPIARKNGELPYIIITPDDYVETPEVLNVEDEDPYDAEDDSI